MADRDSLSELQPELPEVVSMPPEQGAQDDVAALAALASGSRRSLGDAPEDDGKLDLSGAAALERGAHVDEPAELARPARPADPEPRGTSPAAAGHRMWLGVALGVVCGIGAGWALFGSGTGPQTVAAESPSPKSPPVEARSAPQPAKLNDGRAAISELATPKPAARAQPTQEEATAGRDASPSPGQQSRVKPSRQAKPPRKAEVAKAPPARKGVQAGAAAKGAPAAAKGAPAAAKGAPAAAKGAPAAGVPAERTMDRLLDDALTGPNPHAELEQARSDQSLPATPSRADLMGAMKLLLPAIRGCAMGKTGLANISLVIGNDGRVKSAVVAGPPFAGTSAGRCMEGVARRARLPKFQQATFRVRIPLSLQ